MDSVVVWQHERRRETTPKMVNVCPKLTNTGVKKLSHTVLQNIESSGVGTNNASKHECPNNVKELAIVELESP